MSLRARLIAMLVVVAAAGLIVLAAVTYAEQRSFLLSRVEDEGVAALPEITHQLDDGERPSRGGAGPRGDGGPGDGGRGPEPEQRSGSSLYGQLRDASDHAVSTGALVGFGQSAPPPPKWPANPPTTKWTTVDSTSSSGPRYRVRAFPRPDSPGTTVVAVPLGEVDQTLDRLLAVEAVVIVAVTLALAALAWWLVRLGLRPLDRMGATADAIATGDLSRRVSQADERTEVGRLGLALNGMLTQIERAFTEREASESRLRRFLADASHELRTPLASIRGYAELFRLGAARDSAETKKAMTRIEEESARMGVLVENMLMLARLDEIKERSHEPVDLADLVADAANDARAAAPNRRIELESGGQTLVEGDPSQLRQVVGNLIRNAIVHTPDGTPVELSVAGADGHVTVEVRDHGRGLPTDDPAALFERFWRADPGRGRGPAGAGLGLSIVAALVDAHGGSVRAENAAGSGARFVVTLPTHSGSSQAALG